MTAINALLLADGRLPAGGHAHSGGVEAAVSAGRVTNLETLSAFLSGRLATAGFTAAGLAAAACTGAHDWKLLDAEADARTPSPALREASRRQGRQLLRSVLHLWPAEILQDLAAALGHGPHHAVAMGAAAAAAGLCPEDAARSAAYGAVTGPATAAVRLLGLDPLAVHALLSRLAPLIEDFALQAVALCDGPLSSLPCSGSVLLDILAEHHAVSEVRLFAS